MINLNLLKVYSIKIFHKYWSFVRSWAIFIYTIYLSFYLSIYIHIKKYLSGYPCNYASVYLCFYLWKSYMFNNLLKYLFFTKLIVWKKYFFYIFVYIISISISSRKRVVLFIVSIYFCKGGSTYIPSIKYFGWTHLFTLFLQYLYLC